MCAGNQHMAEKIESSTITLVLGDVTFSLNQKEE